MSTYIDQYIKRVPSEDGHTLSYRRLYAQVAASPASDGTYENSNSTNVNATNQIDFTPEVNYFSFMAGNLNNCFSNKTGVFNFTNIITKMSTDYLFNQ